MTNKTYNQLLKELYQLNLKLTEQQLILDKFQKTMPAEIVCDMQFDLVQDLKSKIQETLAQIKEMELEIEQ